MNNNFLINLIDDNILETALSSKKHFDTLAQIFTDPENLPDDYLYYGEDLIGLILEERLDEEQTQKILKSMTYPNKLSSYYFYDRENEKYVPIFSLEQYAKLLGNKEEVKEVIKEELINGQKLSEEDIEEIVRDLFEETYIDYKDLANDLIDAYCEAYDPITFIDNWSDWFDDNKNVFKFLNFNEEDINRVIKDKERIDMLSNVYIFEPNDLTKEEKEELIQAGVDLDKLDKKTLLKEEDEDDEVLDF